MIDVSGAYTLGGKTHRSLASQVNQNTRDIQYLLDNGLLPEGELNITANGEYDVKQKASVNVDVPVGIFPTGTKVITSNGSYDVSEFASALINVSSGNPVNFDGTCTLTIEGLQGHLYTRKIDALSNKIKWVGEEINEDTVKTIKMCTHLNDGNWYAVYDDILFGVENNIPQSNIELQNCYIMSKDEEVVGTNNALYRIRIQEGPAKIKFVL